MNKKILGLVSSLALVSVLAGCGSTTTPTTAPTTAPTAPAEMTGAIKVFTRDSTSGTREAFESIVGFAEKLTNDAFEVSSNGDMATKVGAEKSGIGYVSLTTDFEANNLTPVMYEGVEATIKTVLTEPTSLTGLSAMLQGQKVTSTQMRRNSLLQHSLTIWRTP